MGSTGDGALKAIRIQNLVGLKFVARCPETFRDLLAHKAQGSDSSPALPISTLVSAGIGFLKHPEVRGRELSGRLVWILGGYPGIGRQK